MENQDSSLFFGEPDPETNFFDSFNGEQQQSQQGEQQPQQQVEEQQPTTPVATTATQELDEQNFFDSFNSPQESQNIDNNNDNSNKVDIVKQHKVVESPTKPTPTTPTTTTEETETKEANFFDSPSNDNYIEPNEVIELQSNVIEHQNEVIEQQSNVIDQQNEVIEQHVQQLIINSDSSNSLGIEATLNVETPILVSDNLVNNLADSIIGTNDDDQQTPQSPQPQQIFEEQQPEPESVTVQQQPPQAETESVDLTSPSPLEQPQPQQQQQQQQLDNNSNHNNEEDNSENIKDINSLESTNSNNNNNNSNNNSDKEISSFFSSDNGDNNNSEVLFFNSTNSNSETNSSVNSMEVNSVTSAIAAEEKDISSFFDQSQPQQPLQNIDINNNNNNNSNSNSSISSASISKPQQVVEKDISSFFATPELGSNNDGNIFQSLSISNTTPLQQSQQQPTSNVNITPIKLQHQPVQQPTPKPEKDLSSFFGGSSSDYEFNGSDTSSSSFVAPTLNTGFNQQHQPAQQLKQQPEKDVSSFFGGSNSGNGFSQQPEKDVSSFFGGSSSGNDVSSFFGGDDSSNFFEQLNRQQEMEQLQKKRDEQMRIQREQELLLQQQQQAQELERQRIQQLEFEKQQQQEQQRLYMLNQQEQQEQKKLYEQQQEQQRQQQARLLEQQRQQQQAAQQQYGYNNNGNGFQQQQAPINQNQFQSPPINQYQNQYQSPPTNQFQNQFQSPLQQLPMQINQYQSPSTTQYQSPPIPMGQYQNQYQTHSPTTIQAPPMPVPTAVVQNNNNSGYWGQQQAPPMSVPLAAVPIQSPPQQPSEPVTQNIYAKPMPIQSPQIPFVSHSPSGSYSNSPSQNRPPPPSMIHQRTDSSGSDQFSKLLKQQVGQPPITNQQAPPIMNQVPPVSAQQAPPTMNQAPPVSAQQSPPIINQAPVSAQQVPPTMIPIINSPPPMIPFSNSPSQGSPRVPIMNNIHQQQPTSAINTASASQKLNGSSGSVQFFSGSPSISMTTSHQQLPVQPPQQHHYNNNNSGINNNVNNMGVRNQSLPDFSNHFPISPNDQQMHQQQFNNNQQQQQNNYQGYGNNNTMFNQHQNINNGNQLMQPPQQPGMMNGGNNFFHHQRSTSWNGNDAHQRGIPFYSRPHPVFAFGFGGKVVSIKAVPNGSGTSKYPIQLTSIKSLIGHNPFFNNMSSFPGPLSSSSSKDTINKWISERVHDIANGKIDTFCSKDLEASTILWEILKVLNNNYGNLVNTNSSDKDDKSVAKSIQALLLDNKSTQTIFSNIHGSGKPVKTDLEMNHILNRVQTFMNQGDIISAHSFALDNELWSHALVLAHQLGPEAYGRTMSAFTNSTLPTGSPLKTLYSLYSGNTRDLFKDIPQQINNNNGMNQNPTVGQMNGSFLESWKENIATLLFNGKSNGCKVIGEIGDCIWQVQKRIEAAHICYLLADYQFGPFNNPGSRIVLLGGDHKIGKHFITSESLQRSEIYEFSKILGNSQYSLPIIFVYKFIYATYLADFGLIDQAMKYLQHIKHLLKNHQVSNPCFIYQLDTFAERITSFSSNNKLSASGSWIPSIFTKGFKILGGKDSNANTSSSNIRQLPNTTTGGNAAADMISPTNTPISTPIKTVDQKVVAPSTPASTTKLIKKPQFNDDDDSYSSFSTNKPKAAGNQSSNDLTSGDSNGSGNANGSTSPAKDEPAAESKPGLLAGLFWRKKPKTKEMNLDNNNNFYFNEELGKWVERGKEAEAAAASAPPPPPPTESYSPSQSDGMTTPPPFGGNVGSSSPPILNSSSGGSPLPPSMGDSSGGINKYSLVSPGGANTRRKPRYVDTLNQTVYNGGSNSNLTKPTQQTSTFTPFTPMMPAPMVPSFDQQPQQDDNNQQPQPTNPMPMMPSFDQQNQQQPPMNQSNEFNQNSSPPLFFNQQQQ